MPAEAVRITEERGMVKAATGIIVQTMAVTVGTGLVVVRSLRPLMDESSHENGDALLRALAEATLAEEWGRPEDDVYDHL